MSSMVYAKLPRAGLANKLFVWARAFLFARNNSLPLVVTRWWLTPKNHIFGGNKIHTYMFYFKATNQSGLFRSLYNCFFYMKIKEPGTGKTEVQSKTVYFFNEVPHWGDYFGGLRNNRNEIRDGLFNILTKSRSNEIKKTENPIICVQIRMGDFKPLKDGVNFATVGGTRTPLNYFVDLICNIRKLAKSNLPVTIVTDGQLNELKEIFDLGNVVMGGRHSAIADIFMMSKSKILITSAGSTFGYWGGFLGDNILIMHPQHLHTAIRPAYVNEKFYEGPVIGDINEWPELLKNNIRDI